MIVMLKQDMNEYVFSMKKKSTEIIKFQSNSSGSRFNRMYWNSLMYKGLHLTL